MFNDNYLYKTQYGKAVVGDSLELMKQLPDGSINLVVTSPPFALSRPKEYGNKGSQEIKIRRNILIGFSILLKKYIEY